MATSIDITAELFDAAREYAVASDRYHAACRRLDIARGKQNVPREEWDDATVAACKAVNDAQRKLGEACERLFPQTEANAAWKEYSARFWPETGVAVTMYPRNWPRCECGDYVLDGHLTCGRVECGTQADAEARRHAQDRRCPDCQNWLDRYGRCLQCAEPAGEL